MYDIKHVTLPKSITGIYLPLLQVVILKTELHHEETGLYSQKKKKEKGGKKDKKKERPIVSFSWTISSNIFYSIHECFYSIQPIIIEN